MIKTRKIKVKSVENEEIIMAMTMTKTIITKIIIPTLKCHNKKASIYLLNKKTLIFLELYFGYF